MNNQHDVYKDEEFKRIIFKETCKLSRIDGKSSIVFFNVENNKKTRLLLQSMTEKILNRKRIGDELGFFGKHQMAILLLLSDRNNAEFFLRDVLNNLTEDEKKVIVNYSIIENNSNENIDTDSL